MTARGFSLIEVLLALVLFATGVLGVVHGLHGAQRLVGRARARHAATGALVARMEQMRGLVRTGCPALLAGSDTVPDWGWVTWRIESSGNLAMLTAAVAIPRTRVGGGVEDTLRSLVWCG